MDDFDYVINYHTSEGIGNDTAYVILQRGSRHGTLPWMLTWQTHHNRVVIDVSAALPLSDETVAWLRAMAESDSYETVIIGTESNCPPGLDPPHRSP